jgi:hypothetical protein
MDNPVVVSPKIESPKMEISCLHFATGFYYVYAETDVDASDVKIDELAICTGSCCERTFPSWMYNTCEGFPKHADRILPEKSGLPQLRLCHTITGEHVLVAGPMTMCRGGHPHNGIEFITGLGYWIDELYADKEEWPEIHHWPAIYWGQAWSQIVNNNKD